MTREPFWKICIVEAEKRWDPKVDYEMQKFFPW